MLFETLETANAGGVCRLSWYPHETFPFVDAALPQNVLEFVVQERTLVGLVEHDLIATRCELGNDSPAGILAQEYPPTPVCVSGTQAVYPGAPLLVRRQVGEIRPMALSSEDDRKVQPAHALENPTDRLHSCVGVAVVFAQLIYPAPGPTEIDLRVDG